MNTARTIKIIRLVKQALLSFTNNEPYRLTNSLEQLDSIGGIYIKFLQMAVLQMDTASQKDFGAVLSVYEHSKPDRLDILAYLKRENAILYHRLLTIEPEPFATGSFGQVYRAVMVGGEHVVVKILRPSVQRHLRADLRLLGIMSVVISIFDRTKLFNFRNIYREFRRTSLAETDYVYEATLASTYHRQFAQHSHLVIPYTYQEYSNATVLVQELIEGISVAQALERQSSHQDARAYINHALDSDLYQQLFTIGYELLSKALYGETFHADPHPGNILLLRNNKVALIDFGMSTSIRQDRLAFYELLVEYQKFYNGKLEIENFMMASLQLLEPSLYRALKNAGQLIGSQRRDELYTRLKQVAKDAAEAEDVQHMVSFFMERRMIMRILAFAINKNNRFGFDFDMKSAVMLKAVQTFIILTLKFDEDSVIVRHVINSVVEDARSRMDEIANVGLDAYSLDEHAEVIATWFDRISRRDPWFLQQIAGRHTK